MSGSTEAAGRSTAPCGVAPACSWSDGSAARLHRLVPPRGHHLRSEALPGPPPACPVPAVGSLAAVEGVRAFFPDSSAGGDGRAAATSLDLPPADRYRVCHRRLLP